jgi:hypothetical protein
MDAAHSSKKYLEMVDFEYAKDKMMLRVAMLD